MTTARTERALQDIAAYLKSIDKSLGKIAQAAEASTAVAKLFQENHEDGLDIGFSIPVAGVNWCMNDVVEIVDPASTRRSYWARVLNARNFPDNFELGVVFSSSVPQELEWFRPDQLKKLNPDRKGD